MSLTSYFKASPEARTQVKNALNTLRRPEKTPPIIAPESKRYSVVGTAFDYLLRSMLVRQHAGLTLIHAGSPCLALHAAPHFGRKSRALLESAFTCRRAFEEHPHDFNE